MRSRKSCIMAAAVFVLLSATVIQSAASAPFTPFVSLTASPKVLVYPSIVTLTALASDAETTTATLQARRVDLAQWSTIETAQSATGRFVFLQLPRYGYEYRVVVGSAESTASVVVRVPLSKPRADTTRVKVGHALHISGTIRPFHSVGSHPEDVKYRLNWQKYDPLTKKWRASSDTSISIANAVDNDTSQWVYDLTARPSHVGSWRVRFFHQSPRHAASYSPWLGFAVVK